MPEEWHGEVDGHSFYFRERHDEWRIVLDLRPSGRFSGQSTAPTTTAPSTTKNERWMKETSSPTARSPPKATGPRPSSGRSSSSTPSKPAGVLGMHASPRRTVIDRRSRPRHGGAVVPSLRNPPGQAVVRGRLERQRSRHQNKQRGTILGQTSREIEDLLGDVIGLYRLYYRSGDAGSSSKRGILAIGVRRLATRTAARSIVINAWQSPTFISSPRTVTGLDQRWSAA